MKLIENVMNEQRNRKKDESIMREAISLWPPTFIRIDKSSRKIRAQELIKAKKKAA